jgi:Cryptococcal mannosyltransferase 1
MGGRLLNQSGRPVRDFWRERKKERSCNLFVRLHTSQMSISWRSRSRHANVVYPAISKAAEGFCHYFCLPLDPLRPRPRPKTTYWKIFISSTHWNDEDDLRSRWIPAVLDLVKCFGVEDVYLSVYESGSWDDSKGALRSLDKELGALGARRTVVLDETTHGDW